MGWLARRSRTMVSREQALPGRATPMKTQVKHSVYRERSIQPPFPDGMATAVFGMGCFWGAEQQFWLLPGVWSTAVGYAGGFTPNPTYGEVCSGRTGHTEVLLAVYDPAAVSYATLLRTFWEGHNPTQGMRQGADVGTQYRSAIYWTTESQRAEAEHSKATYQQSLTNARHGTITTETAPLQAFYYAEPHHQQYLDKNPFGYCGHGGTGVACPIGLALGEG
jgi:peptide-methionine (S)-S-oxide reductase